MTTFTAATALRQARQPHTGVQGTRFLFGSGAAKFGSAGDVIVLCRVPNYATIFECHARVNVRNDGGGELRLYLTRAGASETTTLAGVGSLSVSVLASPLRFSQDNDFAPFKLTITSNHALQYAWLKCQILNGTATTSFSIDGYILFSMNAGVFGDGPADAN